MTVLVIGGTGTTGRPLVELLRGRGTPVRVGSRHPNGPDHVRFDWADPDSHRAALDGADRVYLVPPVGVLDPMPLVGPFLERAAGRRVVLLSSSLEVPDAPGLLELRDRVARTDGGAVLRPSGFMQNFTGEHPVAVGVRGGEIVTATGSGRIGWIDAADIAAVAARLLTERHDVTGEHVLTGPDALSYADAARIVTEVTGRPVRHRCIGVDELARALTAALPADFAAALAAADALIRDGAEDRTTSAVADLTGRPPRDFRDFVRSELR